MLDKEKIKNETLLLGGCSFSLERFSSIHANIEDITDTWPSLLGFKEVINVAKGGKGNEYMINKCIEHLLSSNADKSNPDRIIIALTEWDRFDTPYCHFTPSMIMWNTPEEVREFTVKEPRWANREGNTFWLYEKFGNPDYNVAKEMATISYRAILTLHEMCLSRKIPLHIFQLLKGWSFPESGKQLEMFSRTKAIEMFSAAFFKNEFAKQLVTTAQSGTLDLVGYPFCHDWGGSSIWGDIIRAVEKEDRGRDRDARVNALCVSDVDGHPSILGHQKISEKVLNVLNHFEL